jgi:carbamoyl-phosphate synthase large subunit
LLVAAQALREGMTVAEIHAIAKFDPWFLERLEEIIAEENAIKANGLPNGPEGTASSEGDGLFGQATWLIWRWNR